MGLDKFLTKKSAKRRKKKSTLSNTSNVKADNTTTIVTDMKKNLSSDLEESQKVEKEINLLHKKSPYLESKKVNIHPKKETKPEEDKEKRLIELLAQKFQSKTQKELIKFILDLVRSSPLYIDNKNLIMVFLDGDLQKIGDFTPADIAFELGLNVKDVEILLEEIKLDWNLTNQKDE